MPFGGMTFVGAFTATNPYSNLILASSYLSFVREAFTGIPTIFKEIITPDIAQSMLSTSDIMYAMLADAA
jgi:hypothetical protein